MNKKINGPKPITLGKYTAKMNEIIRKHGTVADALIEMLKYSATIKLTPMGSKKHNG